MAKIVKPIKVYSYSSCSQTSCTNKPIISLGIKMSYRIHWDGEEISLCKKHFKQFKQEVAKLKTSLEALK